MATRPAQSRPARSERHRARPHEGPGAVAEVASARIDEVARKQRSPARPSVPARFRAVLLESKG